ncbi:hypothetical protein [Ralstonia solanacearum]|nr:hypothetical protein [Ralstonia solanacearum]
MFRSRRLLVSRWLVVHVVPLFRVAGRVSHPGVLVKGAIRTRFSGRPSRRMRSAAPFRSPRQSCARFNLVGAPWGFPVVAASSTNVSSKAFPMHASIGTLLIVAGFSLTILSQIVIALHAFTGNPLQGVLCLFVPLYVYRYAQKHAVGRMLMRAWYAGLAALAAGTVLLS